MCFVSINISVVPCYAVRSLWIVDSLSYFELMCKVSGDFHAGHCLMEYILWRVDLLLGSDHKTTS
jgi:hypothetical protein